MAAVEGNGASLPFRVRQLERQIERLEDWRGEHVDPQRATQTEQLKTVTENMAALRSEMRGVRRALTTFTVTIAVSCLGFALTVLAASGKI